MGEDPVVNREAAVPPRQQELDPLLTQLERSAQSIAAKQEVM
jgi:hypothetical protein